TTLQTRTPRAGRSGTPWPSTRRDLVSATILAGATALWVKIRLPAAAPGLLVGGPRLVRLLAVVLPLLEAPLDHAHHEDEQREEDDEDEARVGDHLVVGGAVPAPTAVVCQRRGRQHEEGDRGGGEHGGEALHQVLDRIGPRRHDGAGRRAAGRRHRG